MSHRSSKSLKIGYVWQYSGVGMSNVSASVLHIKAVRQALQQHGHQVRLITFQDGRLQWTDDLENWHPADLGRSQTSLFRILERVIRGLQSRLHLPFFRLFDSHRFAGACLSTLAGCDVLYERYWLMAYGGLWAAKRLGIPLIYEVNGDLVEEYSQLGIQLSKAQWAVVYLINRLMFQKAGRVITVSDKLREQTIRRWRLHPAQVTVVKNGAQVDLFANPGQTQSVWSRYRLNGEPVIMFVGSFKPWHGIDLLVDAFSQVAAHNSTAKLLLVGDGPTQADLKDQVQKLQLQDRVVFTGMIAHQEVAALLSQAQVAVLNPRLSPASAAQSPLKLFEYMAAGKAIVAPAAANIERLLTHRQNALLVPPDDSEALANAFIELLEDDALCLKLGQTAKAEALSNHSWDRAAAEIEAVMYELLNKSQPQV